MVVRKEAWLEYHCPKVAESKRMEWELTDAAGVALKRQKRKKHQKECFWVILMLRQDLGTTSRASPQPDAQGCYVDFNRSGM